MASLGPHDLLLTLENQIERFPWLVEYFVYLSKFHLGLVVGRVGCNDC